MPLFEGVADKLGNRSEAYWIVRELLRVLILPGIWASRPSGMPVTITARLDQCGKV